jgi:hypothetical protein
MYTCPPCTNIAPASLYQHYTQKLYPKITPTQIDLTTKPPTPFSDHHSQNHSISHRQTVLKRIRSSGPPFICILALQITLHMYLRSIDCPFICTLINRPPFPSRSTHKRAKKNTYLPPLLTSPRGNLAQTPKNNQNQNPLPQFLRNSA